MQQIIEQNIAAAKGTLDDWPINYLALNWWQKVSVLDPINYAIWESRNKPRIIPSEEEAVEIGLAHDWHDYMVEA